MSKEDFKSFDIKLTDGRYFKNVIVCSEFCAEDKREIILDNQFTSDEKQSIKIEMVLYHIEDDECNNILAVIHSDDIEYICNSYRDREVI